MKIVCDACQAKYSISDDKVQGKVFKIRCKKCSNIIVVRGGAQAAEPAPAPQEKDTRVYDYGYDGGAGAAPPGDDAVWHLVINQDQVGPMTAGEVHQRFAAGECDGETFAWREGFADWLPLAQVDVFAGLVASGSTTAAQPPGGGGHQAVAAMFGSGDDVGGTVRSDSGDLFAAASASSHHQADDDGGDLFGGGQRAAKSGGAAASAAQQKMRGERNENSVLFSLNNLAQLASDKPAPAPSSAGHATGAAGGEGSGLIDIRSMASAYLGGGGAAVAKPAGGSGIGSIDDLPVFGGGGFSEPAVIVPSAARASNNKVLYLMIGAVGLLAIVAVVMVMVLLKTNKTTVVAAAPTEGEKGSDTKPVEKPDTGSGSAAPAGSAVAAGSADATGSGSATQVAQATPTPAPTPAHPAPAPTPAPAHHDTHSTPSHVVAAATPPPSHHTDTPSSPSRAPEKAPAGGDTGGSCDEVSCVLNNYEGACCTKFKKGGHGGGGGGGAATPPSGGGGGGGASNLPDALDKGMISGAIAAVKGRVSSCGDKSQAKGVVKVHVKVSGSGGVSDVSVSQTPDPALGACVSAAVKRASFPKTQSGGSFSYPFVF